MCLSGWQTMRGLSVCLRLSQSETAPGALPKPPTPSPNPHNPPLKNKHMNNNSINIRRQPPNPHTPPTSPPKKKHPHTPPKKQQTNTLATTTLT